MPVQHVKASALVSKNWNACCVECKDKAAAAPKESMTFPRFYRHLHKEENDEIGGQYGRSHTTSVYRGL